MLILNEIEQKPTKYWWGVIRGPWKLWGIWWHQKTFIGVSSIMNETWEDKPK
jgi:hypothetical protein